MLTGRDIASGLGPLLLLPLDTAADTRGFSKAVVDSRKAAPGDLFIALPGEHADGHQFIADAISHGATGILAKDWPEDVSLDTRSSAVLFKVADPLTALQTLSTYWRNRSEVKVVGVTGSVGKTTTKEAIAVVLSTRYNVLKSTGNLNTEIGLPLVLLELEERHQRAVLEMGMYRQGDIALLCGLAHPEIGVVTNVGPTHLERLRSMDNIAAAKAELVESLPVNGTAVLNADDARVAAMRANTRARVITYGLSQDAQCRAIDVASHGLGGVGFTLTWEGASQPVELPLPGRHNVYTALAAASVGLAEGFALDEIATALQAPNPGGRIQTWKTAEGATIIDDSYNASPISMKAALDLLSEMQGTRIAVLGDMYELGSAAESGHLDVGHYAATHADALYTIGPKAATISAAAKANGLRANYHYDDLEYLAGVLRGRLGPDVYVLVKASRGMALERLVAQLCEA